MNPENRIKNSGLIISSSFILSLVIIGSVMAANHVTPFGRQNLLIGDMGAQYSAFFTGLHNVLTGSQFSWFSFSVGVGENTFPLIAYYLLSPFNLIMLLFSASQIPTAITCLLMLKTATISVTMSFYLIHHFHRANWMIPFFGLTFSLSGFIAANFVNLMWLDGLICLPLICYGIDQIREGRHSVPLFIWLTVAIMINYYIGYMIGLFTMVYTVTEIISNKNSSQSLGQVISLNRPFIGSVILTELFSVLTTMVILLPAALGMLQTAKVIPSGMNEGVNTSTPQFGWEILSQIGMGNMTYSNRLYHAPAIFSSIAIIILFASYLAHPAISHQRKTGTLFAVGLLLLSMLIAPLNIAWHMFNAPYGSPFRYSFLLSFVIITSAYAAWLANPRNVSKPAKWMITLGVCTALIGGFTVIRIGTVTYRNTYLSLQPNSPKLLAINLFLVVILSALIFMNRNYLLALMLGSFMALEMGVNFGYAIKSDPLGNQQAYEKGFRSETEQLSSPVKSQTKLYRLNDQNIELSPAFGEPYLGYNDPITFNYHGIQEYSSTLREPVRQSLENLGFFSKNERRISNVGATAISEMLLGVKYNLTPSTKPTPNSVYVGMGFPVTAKFVDLKLQTGTPFANLSSTLRAIKTDSTHYLLPQTIRQESISTSSMPGLYHASFTINPTQSGPLYLTTLSPRFRAYALMVNGHQVSLLPNELHKKYIIKLGTFSVANPVHVTIAGASNQTIKHVQVQSLNADRLRQLASNLRSQSFQPTYHGDVLKGSFNHINSQQHWGYIAIPDAVGWSTTVNGQHIIIHKALGDFMAIPLTAGVNHIRMTYHVPGLSTGIGLSLFGLMGYLLWIIMIPVHLGKHQKRKTRH